MLDTWCFTSAVEHTGQGFVLSHVCLCPSMLLIFCYELNEGSASAIHIAVPSPKGTPSATLQPHKTRLVSSPNAVKHTTELIVVKLMVFAANHILGNSRRRNSPRYSSRPISPNKLNSTQPKTSSTESQKRRPFPLYGEGTTSSHVRIADTRAHW